METLQRTANRGSISTGFDIDNSLKFEPDNAETIATTNQAAGNQKTWTWSCWLKRTELGSLQTIFGAGETYIRFDTPDIIQTSLGGNFVSTNAKFRDTSAWYHLVWILDTTQATAADRSRIYINGSQITSFSAATYPSQNADLTVGGTGSSTNFLRLAQYWAGGRNYAGYMAEVHYLNGTVAEPTEFGEYDSDSGIWIPKKYTGGGYGTQGFYYKFDNSSNLGEDSSGEGHDANSISNITSADQATDTPTNNFCTLNPLFTGFNSTVQLPLNGATQYGVSGGNQDLSYAGTMGVTKGKWYFENYINEVVATYGARIYVGFHTFQQDYDGVQVGASTNGDALAVWQMDAGNYVAWNGGSRSITSGLGTVGSGGVGKFVGIALNLDDNQISFYYDGSAVTNGTNLPLYNMGSQTDDGIFAIPVVQTKGSIQTANFGGYIPSNFISSAVSDANGYGTFEHAPPSGYYALCTKNLAEYG